MPSQTVISFKAGYAEYDQTTHVVTCHPGSGRVTVTRETDDPYLYFSWSPRDGFVPPPNFTPLDSFVLIPGDAKWSHVKQCTTGRVFALKFASSELREFFWMQSKTDSGNKPGDLSKEDKKVLEILEKALYEEPEEDDDDDEEPKMDQDEEALLPAAVSI